MVSIAVAVANGNIGTTTLVYEAGAIANPTGIQSSNAAVNIVADAVIVCVFCARPTALSNCVGHIAVAVTIAIGNVCTPAFIGGSRAIANAAFIIVADARVFIIANSICIGVSGAVSSTDADGIECRAAAIIVGGLFIVVAGLFVHTAWNFCVVAHIVAVNIRRAIAIAYAQSVISAYAGVDVVTDAIIVLISFTGSIADVQGVIRTNARVIVVANAIVVSICFAGAAADAQGIGLVAIAVTVAWGII